MDPNDVNALVMALSGRNPPGPPPMPQDGPPQGMPPPGGQPMDLRTQGLINALQQGGPQLGQTLIEHANQERQFQSQAPLRTAQAQHAQAQADELRQRMRNEGPQAALEGQTPGVYEMLTKRASVPKFAVNPVNGALYDTRTGLGAGGKPAGGGSGLTGDALDQLAEQFHTTGALPPVGRGAGAAMTIKSIVNRAAELHPEGDLAGNKAGYKADSASLASQQEILDNAEGWERTGKANLGVLLDVAQKLKDTGSPWLNGPVRTFMEKGAGDPNQTAFKAAHATVVNEYAKILSGAQGSGSVTEGARHEAESMLPLDSTFEQMAAAARILDTDAGNRIGSARQQVATIRGRASGKAPAAPAAQAAGAQDNSALRKKYGL